MDQKKFSQLTSNELTPLINKNNGNSVRDIIKNKIMYNRPYYSNSQTVTNVITDMDHFPYSRYFRGVSYFPEPIIFEREAGWREQEPDCYRTSCSGKTTPYPNHCFESACSTVYPCYPPYFSKFSDKDALNIQLNKACIVQHR